MNYEFLKDCEAVDNIVKTAINGTMSKEEALQKIETIYLHSMVFPKSYMEIAIRKVKQYIK